MDLWCVWLEGRIEQVQQGDGVVRASIGLGITRG
jgi:hypothetical protein